MSETITADHLNATHLGKKISILLTLFKDSFKTQHHLNSSMKMLIRG